MNKEQQLEAQARRWEYEARCWQSRFDAAKQRQGELEAENAELKAKLKLREKQLFERRSGKAAGNGREQANPENQQASRNPRGQQKGKARRNSSRRDHSDLPVRQEYYDVDEAQQRCPVCGQVNPRIDSADESEIIEIEVKGYRRKIIKNKRRKGCRCDNYETIKEHNLSATLWGGDETGYKVFVPVEGKVGNRWQLWVFHSHQAVVYLLKSSRSAQAPLDYFNKQAEGILVVDRYSAYKKLARLYSGLTLAFCWAHLRRDFLDCATRWPTLQAWAFEWVERINQLFHINNSRREAFFSGGDYRQEEQQLRREIEAFKAQVDRERTESYVPAGKSAVLESLNNHWQELTVFVDHPEVPMDNNGSE